MLREIKSSYCTLLSIAGGLCLFIAGAASFIPALASIIDIAAQSGLSGYASLLLKALGIGYTTELTSDICRASGADTTASGIELVGRVEIFLLACPLLSELIKSAVAVI